MVTTLFNQLPPFDMTLTRNEFTQILNNELQFYISQISPGDGIALNEALSSAEDEREGFGIYDIVVGD